MSGYISMNEMQQRLERLEKVVSEHLGEHRAEEDRQEFLKDRPATSSVLSEAEQRTGVADPLASGRFVVDLGNPEVVGVVASNGESWSTYIDPKASPTGIPFEAALVYLKAGREVRRPHWNTPSRRRVQPQGIRGRGGLYVITGASYNEGEFKPDTSEMMALDWEVVPAPAWVSPDGKSAGYR